MGILQKQPEFQLKIEGVGLFYKVEVNGSEVFRQRYEELQTSTYVPVNQFMISGKNSIGVVIYGDELQEMAKLKVSLVVNDSQSPEEQFIVTDINFDNSKEDNKAKLTNSLASGFISAINNFLPSDRGEIEISDIATIKQENKISFSREAIIPSSIPVWKYLTSGDIEDADQLSDEDYYKLIDELYFEYRKIQLAIKNKQIDKILSLFSERNEELELAYYSPKGTLEYKIKARLNSLISDDEVEFIEVTDPQSINIIVHSNRKLAYLYFNDSSPLISFRYKDGSGSYSFPLIFRRENGEWILTR